MRDLSALIKEEAFRLGFDICGIARPVYLADKEKAHRSWLERGMNGKMAYLENDPARRYDPSKIYPHVRSVIVTGISYYSEPGQTVQGVPLISRYAYGADYHELILSKLGILLASVKENFPEADGKLLCDTGYFHEKSWIREAGLGWQGKHSIMINREIGSFFFIGIILLNLEAEFDEPFSGDHCGSCRLCIDACPSSCINDDRTIDASRCISNLTIENRGPIPDDLVKILGGRLYGCDKCQEVCPWNRDHKQNNHSEFSINPELASMTRSDWESLTEERFRQLFRKTAVMRVKFADFKRNITDALRSLEMK